MAWMPSAARHRRQRYSPRIQTIDAAASGGYGVPMAVSGFHIAQVNIAMPVEPLTSDRLSEFVDLLDPVNALADHAPGFVWRLQTEDGDATAVRAFGDDRLIVNMSVWESIEDLSAFVFGGFPRRGHATAPGVVHQPPRLVHGGPTSHRGGPDRGGPLLLVVTPPQPAGVQVPCSHARVVPPTRCRAVTSTWVMHSPALQPGHTATAVVCRSSVAQT
jgi:hypothetical protein